MVSKLENLVDGKIITPLSLDDESLFREQIRRYKRYSLHFEDSWAYVLQATRNLPLKYVTKNAFLTLTVKQDDAALVIPNHFAHPNQLATIAKSLTQTVGKPIILKNVEIRSIHQFIDHGFDVYQSHEVWDAKAPYDDQTFPQHILKIEELLSLSGKPYRKVRTELNGCSRSMPDIDIIPYDPRLHFYEVSKLCAKQEERNKGTLAAHELFLAVESNGFLQSFVYAIDDHIIAYTVTDRISFVCAAANALIYDTTIPDLPTRVIYEAARLAHEEGYIFLNLQGSETRTLDRWKRKFNPILSIKNTHLIYRA